jgi:hypothetical protein
MNVAEMAAKSPTVGDLDIDFRGLYLLAAPSTPTEVVEDVAALGRKITAEDVAQATSARKTADGVQDPAAPQVNRAPSPPKPKLVVKTPPERDPIEVIAGKIVDRFSGDGKWRSTSTIATAFQVANTAARDALKTLPKDCFDTRARGDVIEFRFKRSEVADLRSALVARDAEIARLQNRIAEQDAEIERLTKLSGPPFARRGH